MSEHAVLCEEHRRIGLDMQAANAILSSARVAMGARHPRSTAAAERTYAAQRLRRMRKAFGALWTRLDDAALPAPGGAVWVPLGCGADYGGALRNSVAELRRHPGLLGPAPRPGSPAPR